MNVLGKELKIQQVSNNLFNQKQYKSEKNEKRKNIDSCWCNFNPTFNILYR